VPPEDAGGRTPGAAPSAAPPRSGSTVVPPSPRVAGPSAGGAGWRGCSTRGESLSSLRTWADAKTGAASNTTAVSAISLVFMVVAILSWPPLVNAGPGKRVSAHRRRRFTRCGRVKISSLGTKPLSMRIDWGGKSPPFPRNSPLPRGIRTASLQPTVSVSGKRVFDRRDKAVETTLKRLVSRSRDRTDFEIARQFPIRRRRDGTFARIAANSAPPSGNLPKRPTAWWSW
jgi:hypothetical protein